MPICSLLCYHRILSETKPVPLLGGELFVSQGTFEKQAKILAEKFRALSLDEFELAINGKKAFPEKAVLITFDDGYQDNYSCAFPILKKYNLPFVLFITADFIREKPNKVLPEQEQEYLSWAEISEIMRYENFALGSHSLSHPVLSQLSFAEATREIADSKKIIEEKSGVKIKAFSIPFGKKHHYNPENLEIIKKNYEFCFAYGGGHLNRGNLLNRYEIPRLSPVIKNSWEFKQILSGGQSYSLRYFQKARGWAAKLKNKIIS